LNPAGLVIVGREEHDRLVLALAQAWAPERGASFEARRQREDLVLAEVAQVCRAYGVSRVYTDQYAASAVIERLSHAGLYVESIPMSANSKTRAFGEMRGRLYTGSLELYQHPTLIDQLKRLRSKFTAGSAQVVNPRVGGSHGDLAQALALACHAVRERGPQPAAALTVAPSGVVAVARRYSDSVFG
jgi:hypothetical protein